MFIFNKRHDFNSNDIKLCSIPSTLKDYYDKQEETIAHLESILEAIKNTTNDEEKIKCVTGAITAQKKLRKVIISRYLEVVKKLRPDTENIIDNIHALIDAYDK